MSIIDIPVWEWCWMAFAAFSALLHLLVLFTIIRARQKRSSNLLKAPFFTVIFIQGIHELLGLCTTTGFNRLRKYRIIKYSVEEDNNLVEWQWYWYIFLKNILYFGHVEIAFNRLSAVVFTGITTYDKIWNTSTILLMTIFGYLISAGLRAVVFDPNFQFTTMIFPNSDLFSFEQNGPTYEKQEAILLKIGVATFLILLPTTIRSAAELWAHVTDHHDFLLFVVKWNMLPAEAMCVFQPWLLLLSCKSLRQALIGAAGSAEVSRTIPSHTRPSHSSTHHN